MLAVKVDAAWCTVAIECALMRYWWSFMMMRSSMVRVYHMWWLQLGLDGDDVRVYVQGMDCEVEEGGGMASITCIQCHFAELLRG